MSPDYEGQEGDRCRGVNHRRVTKQRLAAEGWDDLRYNTKGWQDNDVNLWVTKEPEYVLEQYRVTATSSIEEAGTEVNIHQHHGYSAG